MCNQMTGIEGSKAGNPHWLDGLVPDPFTYAVHLTGVKRMRAPGTRWIIIVATCSLAACRAGQGQPPSLQPANSTLAGVFTKEQAISGQYLYQIECRSCHYNSRWHISQIKIHW